MSHEQDRDSAHRDLTEAREETFHPIPREMRSGLVEDQHASVPSAQSLESAHDRHLRSVDRRERRDHRPGIDVNREPRERLPNEPTLPPPRNSPAKSRGVRAEPDILEHGRRVDQTEILVHEADPETHRLARGQRQRDLGTLDLQTCAGVGRVIAREDLDQRRLPRAVLTDQAMDAAAREVEIDVGEYPAVTESFRPRA